MKKSIFAAGAVFVMMLGPAAAAQTGTQPISSLTFVSEQVSSTFNAAVDSAALRIAIEGLADDPPLTVAQGTGTAAFQRNLVVRSAPALPTELLTACDKAGAVEVAGAPQCLDSEGLKARGVAVSGEDARIALGTLIDKGIATLVQVDRDASLQQVQAQADAVGILIPNLALGEASCSGTQQNSAEGLAVPDALAGVLEASVASATCNTSVANFPTATSGSGEIDLAVTLTQTLVDNVPQLNDALDDIQDQLAPLPGELTDPVNTAIDTIQAQLDAAPLVTISVAPNGGTITGAEAGTTAAANAVAVTIDVLGGLIQLEIGTSRGTASILNEEATAESGTSFVRLRVLNILTGEVIEQELASPPADVPLLEGTPLQSRIRAAVGTEEITQCPARGPSQSTTACSASAEADTVSVSLFEGDSPLPNITVDLAGSGSRVEAQFAGAPVAVDLPVVLPRTGAAAMPAVAYGAGLVGLAALIRRRFG